MNRGLRLAAIAIVSFLPTHARASEFSDFRIPAHTWSTGSVTFNGSGNRSRLNADQSYETHRLNGSLGLRGSIVRETEPWQASLQLDASGFGVRQDASNHTHDGSIAEENEHGGDSEHIQTVAELRAYLGESPYSIAMRGTSRHRFDRFHSEERRQESLIPASRDFEEDVRAFREDLDLDLTFGLGRVRDATGVYQTWLLERRWLATGALQRRLSPEARQRLAELFYLERSFAAVHDRPDKRFWNEVERIVRDDGAFSADGLDAYSVLRAIEPPHDRTPVFVRQVGWFAGPVVGVGSRRSHQHQRMREFLIDTGGTPTESEAELRTRAYEDFFAAGARAEAFVPIGMEGQFQIRSEVRHLTTDSGFRPSAFESVEMSSGVAYTHLWNERWSFQGWASHARSITEFDTFTEMSTWMVNYGVDLGFFLEDHLRMSVTVGESQYRQPNVPSDLYRRTGEISVGLSYRFLGFLDAPGLVNTHRIPLGPPRAD